MNFYTAAFLALTSACIFLTCRQYAARDESPEEKAVNPNPVTPAGRAESSKFIRLFLTVYGLVMASDWLQGIMHFQSGNLSCSHVFQDHTYTASTKISSD